MEYGLAIFPTEYAIEPADLARAAEERGFESLWVPEHSHIPCSRRSPFPAGGELPRMYYHVMEPFAVLASMATATRRIKVATGICLLVQRDPIQTAASVATLDRLSHGRFLFGVGAGWNREEMENHGTDPRRRFALLRERVEACKRIWTQERAEYHGELVNFDPLFAWPKPLQKPHPPVHVGGAWPQAAERALRWGDGWLPIHGFGGDVAALVPEFRARAADAGRDPGELEVSIFGVGPEEGDAGPYREAGADRVVFGLPPKGKEEILPLLDRLQQIAERLG